MPAMVAPPARTPPGLLQIWMPAVTPRPPETTFPILAAARGAAAAAVASTAAVAVATTAVARSLAARTAAAVAVRGGAGFSRRQPRPARRSRPSAPARARLMSLAQPRVEGVAQAVPGQVEAEDSDHERDAWVDRDPGRKLHVAAAGAEHCPPGWHRRLGAEPEEAKRRLGQDRGRERKRRLDDQRRGDVRQDVAPDDPPIARADRARGHDVVE